MGFFLRWIFAFVLLALTWNPSFPSYVRWALAPGDQPLSLVVLLGLLLVIAYVVYLRATIRSIGGLGMVLVVAVVAALVWVLRDFGIIDMANPALSAWLGIFALSLVLGVGLSWSLVRRRLSGQADVDDVEE
ncbi:hypothetical protein GCM10011415_08010 [Salipiger pallidus]|uniref:Uncharacterized protein n=1 Tax=Salipiger pallidus TaxID=1775170 RepID=A0A8J2ZHM8_9RHOB|nr:DUF6524 family protein [Salipiger pallidus]GGG63933.1 hypothetical protein GCM10011415_08010 [Salipiger pallidus]